MAADNQEGQGGKQRPKPLTNATSPMGQYIDELFEATPKQLRAMIEIMEEGQHSTVRVERDGHEYVVPLYRCYLTPPKDGRDMGWMLKGHWTDEEMSQVNAVLVQYPLPYDQFKVTQYWIVTKSAETGFYIQQTFSGNAGHLYDALHHADLSELLKIWATIQENGERARKKK